MEGVGWGEPGGVLGGPQCAPGGPLGSQGVPLGAQGVPWGPRGALGAPGGSGGGRGGGGGPCFMAPLLAPFGANRALLACLGSLAGVICCLVLSKVAQSC